MRRRFKLDQDPVDARQFEVTVKQLANSLNFGQEGSIFHGAGLEYAQSRDTPLLETLEGLSAARWVRRAAARNLGIHVNSMSYRVERIESLTGLQLDDPETRVAISIALRARAMLGM